MLVEPFSIQVPDEVLADLEARLRRTRWPDQPPGRPWEQGTDLAYLRRLVAYWTDGFDWRAQERRLNGFHQFRAHLGNLRIHFVHERAVGGHGIPLILTHGWPSSFAEMLSLVPLLTDPRAHGIDGPAFDLVIPSLPGYGFSDRPAHATYRSTARLWDRLMRGLGYEHYGVGGGDFGAGVTTFMALEEPARVLGVHLSTPEVSPYIGADSAPLSPAETAHLEQRSAWDDVERGYSSIQSTRPQTVGYALNDSPAGLAAWILEKWRAWADTDGDLDGRFSRDFLLTMLTLYWVTGTITSSMRDYSTTAGTATRSDRRSTSACRPRSRTLRASSHSKETRHASGLSGCTTSGDGRAWSVADSLRPPKNLSCSPATSRRSSAASEREVAGGVRRESHDLVRAWDRAAGLTTLIGEPAS